MHGVGLLGESFSKMAVYSSKPGTLCAFIAALPPHSTLINPGPQDAALPPGLLLPWSWTWLLQTNHISTQFKASSAPWKTGVISLSLCSLPLVVVL